MRLRKRRWTQVGVDYCLTHNGIRNEDMAVCDFADPYMPEEQADCVLRPLSYSSWSK